MVIDALSWMTGCTILAAGGGWLDAWATKVWANVWDPWFLFGMVAQAVVLPSLHGAVDCE